MSAAMQQIRAAQRLRSSRNWFVLGAIVVSLVPSSFIAATGTFPKPLPASVQSFLAEILPTWLLNWIPPLVEKHVFLIGLFVGIWSGMLAHRWWVRKQPVPECPDCGGSWELVESGPGKNVDLLKAGGQCPHCGIAIGD